MHRTQQYYLSVLQHSPGSAWISVEHWLNWSTLNQRILQPKRNKRRWRTWRASGNIWLPTPPTGKPGSETSTWNWKIWPCVGAKGTCTSSASPAVPCTRSSRWAARRTSPAFTPRSAPLEAGRSSSKRTSEWYVGSVLVPQQNYLSEKERKAPPVSLIMAFSCGRARLLALGLQMGSRHRSVPQFPPVSG